MSNYSDSKLHDDLNSAWFKALSYIKPESVVLDVGCSSGNFGQELINKKNCIVDGIELDRGDYLKAKRKLRNAWSLNIETDNLSGLTERYDYIYFGDVIEHLVTPARTLSRIKHLLKPSGQVVFSIPNMAHLSVRLMLLGGNFKYGETGLLDKTHLHFYDYDEVKRVFTEAGYEIVQLNPVLNDTPKELLQNQLEVVGLKLTKEFLNFTRTTEASVYQFVGAASPVSKKPKHKSLQKISPVSLNQKLLNDTVKHFELLIASKDENINNLKNQHTSTLEELAILKKRFRYVNKAYRVAHKARQVIKNNTHK